MVDVSWSMYRLDVFALDCFGGHLAGMLNWPIECLLAGRFNSDDDGDVWRPFQGGGIVTAILGGVIVYFVYFYRRPSL